MPNLLDRHTARDVLRATLDAIFFHRLFGTIKPKTREVLGVTMPGVSDADMERLMDEKVDVFWKNIENGISKRGQKNVQKKGGFKSMSGKKTFLGNSDRQQFDTALATTLTRAVRTMLTHTSSDRGRGAVPRITNAQGISPFPIRIAVTIAGVEVG
ncbi:hypothetical protein D9757_004625 [Collybiopsis confluens]|uniref:Autophagy-related protein 101 n=1 Tax=Collybiopsis confluens TaxID=2823264 RepID=A0A8H5HS20_9AGAR|nr:hypothetical protein D9757_004625 [Collybiopsis confluens]